MAKAKKNFKVRTESQIRSKYKHAGNAAIIFDDKDLIWLPSRNIPLNWLLGGGIPYGRIVEIFGYESTGKSLLAMDFAYAAQSLEGIVLWGDMEGTYTNYWAQESGIDPSRVEIYARNDIEGFGDWVKDLALFYRSKLSNNEPILVVCDSIAAGETKENIGVELLSKKAEMGNRAKAWDTFFRTRNYLFHQLGVSVIMINQVRSKIGASMFELAETTPGGKAAAFYSSIRLYLWGGKQIKDGKDKKLGRIIRVGIRKNKVAPPKNSLESEMYFLPDKHGYIGFSRYHSLPEILIDTETITKRGSRFYFGNRELANGAEAFMEEIHGNKKMRAFLIKKSGINSISKTRTKLNEIDFNHFDLTNLELDG